MLSTESNLGPLTLRGNGRYAYNSEGVTDRYSKMAWGEHWYVKTLCYIDYTDSISLSLSPSPPHSNSIALGILLALQLASSNWKPIVT